MFYRKVQSVNIWVTVLTSCNSHDCIKILAHFYGISSPSHYEYDQCVQCTRILLLKAVMFVILQELKHLVDSVMNQII